MLNAPGPTVAGLQNGQQKIRAESSNNIFINAENVNQIISVPVITGPHTEEKIATSVPWLFLVLTWGSKLNCLPAREGGQWAETIWVTKHPPTQKPCWGCQIACNSTVNSTPMVLLSSFSPASQQSYFTPSSKRVASVVKPLWLQIFDSDEWESIFTSVEASDRGIVLLEANTALRARVKQNLLDIISGRNCHTKGKTFDITSVRKNSLNKTVVGYWIWKSHSWWNDADKG